MYPDNQIITDLGVLYRLTSLMVQAGDNDSYKIDFYRAGMLEGSLEVPVIGGWGMQTRTITRSSPVLPDTLILWAGQFGDEYRSISEVQAFGSPAPLPGALLLVGPALLGLVGWRRLKNVSA